MTRTTQPYGQQRKTMKLKLDAQRKRQAKAAQ